MLGQWSQLHGLEVWSVRKYLRSEPKGKQNRKRGSKLDPCRENIHALIDDHNLSAVRILEEIRKMGYHGGYTILKEYCHELRKYRRIQAVYGTGMRLILENSPSSGKHQRISERYPSFQT